MKIPRPTIGLFPLTALSAAFIVLVYNQPLWAALGRVVDLASPRGMLIAAAAFILHAGLLAFLFLLFGIGRLQKPLFIVFFVLAAVIGYFGTYYGTIIDRSMIQNVLETDNREAMELVTVPLVLHLLLYGLLPSLAIGFVRLERAPLRREIAHRAAALLVILSVLGVVAFAGFKELALIGREHKELRMQANPLFGMYSAVKYATHRERVRTALPVGEDARQNGPRTKRRPTVFIYVVGETARERDFSLNGYDRKTNPHLEKQPVISYTRAYASGTSTAEALPGMFSHLGPDEYSNREAERYENVLDVLSRAGVRVLWRDNNSGCKGICARIPTEHTAAVDGRPDLCHGEECFDEALLFRLEDHIQRSDSDALIVLHQQGSHGPAYSLRYPRNFAKFTPECKSNSPQDCSIEEIVNAYDNTILYTDYFLDRTIELLKRNSGKVNAMLVYFSDHGESLGENGVYLHGLPKFIAPDEQSHVPFILWMSDGYAKEHGVDRDCLARNKNEPYSHANMFHTLLGAFRVSTSVYRLDRDVLAACRQS